MKKKERNTAMMKNNLEIFNNTIQKAKSIAICSHISPDGDAIGSSTGLYLALKDLGKEVYLIKNDKFPDHLNFLEDKSFYTDSEPFETDLFILTDVASIDRMGSGKGFYELSKNSLCIDHHMSNEGFFNNNIIDPYISSTSELIAQLLIEGGYEISKLAATYFYLGITTDTNRFMYDSTDAQTLRVSAKLLDFGADKQLINLSLFDNLNVNYLFLQTEVIKSATFLRDGKFVIAKLSKDQLEKYGIDYDEAEGLVSILRSISGVELSCLIKEFSEDIQKISLRSQTEVNVSKIAMEFGGGGHIRASGCTLKMDLDSAYDTMYKRIEQIQ